MGLGKRLVEWWRDRREPAAPLRAPSELPRVEADVDEANAAAGGPDSNVIPMAFEDR